MTKTILISLIGKETIPNYRAFKEFYPDILVHVFSETTKPAATILSEMCKAKTQIIDVKVEDGNDYTELVEALSQKVLLSADDYLTVNVTGGTKMMAIALNEFARNANTICKVARFYIDLNQQIHWYLENRKESFSEVLTLDEFIGLSGQKIISKDCYNEVIIPFQSTLSKINTFLKNYSQREIWNRFLKDIVGKVRNGANNYESTKQTLNRLLIDGMLCGFRIEWNSEGLLIQKNNVKIIETSLGERQIEWFFFNAGWFELLTAQKLALKYPENEIYMNVEFPSLNNEAQMKNEVDILINDGGKLIFVECKSGKVDTKDIDRIKVRKEVYGGLVSESILITRYPIDEFSLNAEKCDELKIIYKTLDNL